MPQSGSFKSRVAQPIPFSERLKKRPSLLQFLPNSRPWRTPGEGNFSAMISHQPYFPNTEVISG